MSHLLRADKTCQNCRHVVEKRFCPNCGQENAEIDKSFVHLFTHFVEDLVHYDSSFYKTVRTLLFRPGVISREYLSGRRTTFVPPVKLYIFISFLTFFLLSIVVSQDVESATTGSTKVDVKTVDSLEFASDSKIKTGYYKSVKELDSVQASLPENARLSSIEYRLHKKIAQMVEHNSSEEFVEKLMSALMSNIPKVLFVYMPFFAFVLWIFHSKQRWFYFDHGIFTLHYFSFLLLSFSVFLVTDMLIMSISSELENMSLLFALAMVLWWIFYFFRSHHTFYQESVWISRSKSVLMFFINSVLMIIIMGAAIFYSLLSIK